MCVITISIELLDQPMHLFMNNFKIIYSLPFFASFTEYIQPSELFSQSMYGASTLQASYAAGFSK